MTICKNKREEDIPWQDILIGRAIIFILPSAPDSVQPTLIHIFNDITYSFIMEANIKAVKNYELILEIHTVY